jgi:hypothetical protein
MFPIPQHDTWRILDSSKVQTFMECPRKYFFRYILGWTRDAPNIHLVFGEAWHEGMERILLGDSAEQAADAFDLIFRRDFPESMDDIFFPKVPAVARAAFKQYKEVYAGDQFEVLSTEISGTAPIGPDRVLHFRIDAIVRGADGIIGLEHKTASVQSQQWREQWVLSAQVGAYGHVLHCLYEPSEVWGIIVNGTFFRKKDTGFERVPIRKQPDMLQVWLSTLNYYTEMIDANMEELEHCADSCGMYGGCPYRDLCAYRPNPLRYANNGPEIGFKVEWWNPADRWKKNIIKLEKRES